MESVTRTTKKRKVAQPQDLTSSRIQKKTISTEDTNTSKTQSSNGFDKDPKTSKKDDTSESSSNGRISKIEQEPASSVKASQDGAQSTRADSARAPNAAVPMFRKSIGKSMQAARRRQTFCRQRVEATTDSVRATIRKDADQLLRLPLDIRQQIYSDLFRSCGDRVLFRRDSEDPNSKFVVQVASSHYLQPEYVGEQISAESWDVLSQAAFYKTTWVNIKAEELSTFLQGHFPILPRNDPAAWIRHIEIELTLNYSYADQRRKHESLNAADWIDASDDFHIREIDLTTRDNSDDTFKLPKDDDHRSQHQWLMKRYLPRARRAGYTLLMKLPRLERVAFHVYGATFGYGTGEGTESLSELIPIVRHLRDKGIAVTIRADCKRPDVPAELVDVTRFYDLPSEEDEERAVAHELTRHDNRKIPRKFKVTFVGATCGYEPCARVAADRLYRDIEARVEAERRDGPYVDSRPHLAASEERFIKMRWETETTTPDAYLISLADSAAEWELRAEEAVDKGKERKG